MTKKILLWLLATFFLATVSIAEAQQLRLLIGAAVKASSFVLFF
jgi:hypothetical protein